MNEYLTGAVIRELREKHHLTQAQLAERLYVSDKTISKWETGKGYPDITLLKPIASVFGVSIMELLSGKAITNVNVSANMLRSKFYVCPVCGNVVHSIGEIAVSCHGVQLMPEPAEPVNEGHMIWIERTEDEYYVRTEHEMTKNHYISFIAAPSINGFQMSKLYPEGPAEARVKISGVEKIFFYCNRDGLFYANVHQGRHKT